MTGFTFFESYYKAISTLPEEYQGDAYKAIAAYMFDGTEPSAESGLAYTIWLAIKPNLDKSIKRSEAGYKRSNEDQTGNKRKSNANQNRFKTESNEDQTGNKRKSNANQNRIKTESNEDQTGNKRDTGTDTGTDTDPKGKKNPTGSKKAASAYASDPALNSAVKDFIEHRKKMRRPMSDRAISLFMRKMQSLAPSAEGQVALINTAIEHGWLTVYPPDERSGTQTSRGKPTGQSGGKPNRFHNFAQGDYDMDALEMALIKN